MNAAAESLQIQELSQRLFRDASEAGLFVKNEDELGEALLSRAKRDVSFSPSAPDIGFIHRKLDGADLYFLANTANHPIQTTAKFRDAKRSAELWDPFTGRVSSITTPAQIEISLQPYESRLIVFSNSPSNAGPERRSGSPSKEIDLSSDWKLTFTSVKQTIAMPTLHSWSEEEPFKYFSGQVTYQKTIDIPADLLSRNWITLDFGEGTPVPTPDPLPAFNMRAYLEGPVREAAEVYVNGQRVGLVWHPPYSIDLTWTIKPGKNELTIVVGNTAINSLAGRALPDYRLLNDRYGERFVPQGMENLQPLPSGIVGELRLQVSPRH